MCDQSWNTWLCVHWQWNTLEWCQLNAPQASPDVDLVTPLSCVSLSMNTQPSVPTIFSGLGVEISSHHLRGCSYFRNLISRRTNNWNVMHCVKIKQKKESLWMGGGGGGGGGVASVLLRIKCFARNLYQRLSANGLEIQQSCTKQLMWRL